MRYFLVLLLLSLNFNSYAIENTKMAISESFLDVVNNYDLTDNSDMRIGLKSRAGMFYLKSTNKDFKSIQNKIKDSLVKKKKIEIKIETPSMTIISVGE